MRCSAPAANPASLAVINPETGATTYRRGFCTAHINEDRYLTEYGGSRTSQYGCPECGCEEGVLSISFDGSNIYYSTNLSDTHVDETHYMDFDYVWEHTVDTVALRTINPDQDDSFFHLPDRPLADVRDVWTDDYENLRDELRDNMMTGDLRCANCETVVYYEF